MQQPDLLRLSNVTVTFGGGGITRKPPFVALENLDLSISLDTPEIIAVAGESGSGKTTLGRVILGMTRPSQGSVEFYGKEIWKTGAVHSREYLRGVQAVFQDPFSVFNPFYPVEHLLRMPLRMFGIARTRTEQDERIRAALQQVGLKPDQVVGRYPHQLSGGQRQRIVVARALMLRPRLIVADEPVSMIDASLRANVLENLRALRDEHGISIVYITHDLATARQVSDRIFVLYRGRVVESGSASRVIGAPKHPYTNLLMSSVPRPDPNVPWSAETIEKSEGSVTERGACVFLDRCSHKMPVCSKQPLPYSLQDERHVACYLYQNTVLASSTASGQ